MMKRLALLFTLAALLLSAAPSQAAYTFIAATGIGGNSATVTTSAIDTTGADLLVVVVMDDDRTTAVVLSDSKSNPWTGLTKQNSSDFASARIYYCQGCTVGSGHTFSVGSNPNVAGLSVAAFSGSTSTPFDVENGSTRAFSGGATQATGSVTPSVDNELVIAGLSPEEGTPPITIDTGFTIAFQYNATANTGTAIAYLIQTSATAVNPTWTFSAGFGRGSAAVIATFKASGGGGGGSTPQNLPILGVGPGQ